jgi:hypothetical protein
MSVLSDFDSWKKKQGQDTQSSTQGTTPKPSSVLSDFQSWEDNRVVAPQPQQELEPIYEQPVIAKQEEKKSGIKSAGAALLTGVLGGISAAGAGIESFGRKNIGKNQLLRGSQFDPETGKMVPIPDDVETGADRIGGMVEKAGKFIKDEYGARQETIQQSDSLVAEYQSFRGEDGKFDPEKFSDPNVYLNVAAQGVGSMVSIIAGGLAGGPAGAAGAAFFTEKGDAVKEYSEKIAKDQGIDVSDLSDEDIERVDVASTGYGIASGAMEAILPLRFLNKVGKKGSKEVVRSVWQRVPAEVGKSIIIEGGTEGAQKFTQNVIARISITENQDLTENVIDEAIAGAILGGGMGVISGAADTGVQSPAPVQDNVKQQEVAEKPEAPKMTEKAQEVVAALSQDDGDTDVDAVLSNATEEDLSQAQEVFQQVEQKAIDAGDQQTAQRAAEDVQMINDTKVQRDTDVRDSAQQIVDGTSVQDATKDMPRESVKKVEEFVDQAKEIPGEHVEIIESAKKQFEELKGTVPQIEEARAMVSEGLFDGKTTEESTKVLADTTNKIESELADFDVRKRELLAQKSSVTDTAGKRTIQNTINQIDAARNDLKNELTKIEEQASSRGLEIIQDIATEIRKHDKDFDVNDALADDWQEADFSAHLKKVKKSEIADKQTTEPKESEDKSVDKAVEPVEKDDVQSVQEKVSEVIVEIPEKITDTYILERLNTTIDNISRGYSNSSHDPVRKAEREIEGLVDQLNADREQMNGFVKEEKHQELVDRAYAAHVKRYLSMSGDIIAAGSRIASPGVTGPANFNNDRNTKRINSYMAKLDSRTQYRENAMRRLKNQISPRVIKSNDKDAVEKLQTKLDSLKSIHEKMKKANAIVRKGGDDVSVKLSELGYKEDEIERILSTENGKRPGFAKFSLSNSNANIKRVEGRLNRLKTAKATPTEDAGGYSFDGGRVEYNTDDMRVRIFHDNVPDADVRTQMKKAGFRWSPRNKAWQRQLTANGKAAAERLYPRKTEVQPLAMVTANKIETEALSYDTEDAYVNAKLVYHFTDVDFDIFDINKTADQTLWFTTQETPEGLAATGSSIRKEVGLVTENKIAGWDEYDSKELSQLESDGYDFVELPDEDKTDFVVLNPEVIKTESELREIYREAHKNNALASVGAVDGANVSSEAVMARGANRIKTEILAKHFNGNVNDRTYTEIAAFIDTLGDLVSDLNVQLGGSFDVQDSAAGIYDPLSSTVAIFDGIRDTEKLKNVFYHEVGHHLAKFLPADMLQELYVKYETEKEAYLKANPDAFTAYKQGHEAIIAYHSSSKKAESEYKYANIDEYFAELIREHQISKDNVTLLDRAVQFFRDVINAMRGIIGLTKGEDIADRIFDHFLSGESVELTNPLMLGDRIQEGVQNVEKDEHRMREWLNRKYQKNIDKLDVRSAIVVERALATKQGFDGIAEAARTMLNSGVVISDFYMVTKLPEDKPFDGQFVHDSVSEEYRSTMEQMANIVAYEKEMMQQEKLVASEHELLDDETGSQYAQFKDLLRKVRGKDKQAFQQDVGAVKTALVKRGVSVTEIDNIFYSDSMTDDEVLTRFRNFAEKDVPVALYGRKDAEALGLLGKAETALDRVESGKSIMSDEYDALAQRLKFLSERSEALFTGDDRRFIDASKELKQKIESLKHDREKQQLVRASARLGKKVANMRLRAKLKNLQSRKKQIATIKEFFNLTESQFRKIGGRRDVQYMSEEDYKEFMERFESAAQTEQERSDALSGVHSRIAEMELQRTDNLRKAMNLPSIEKMTLEELGQFDEAMEPYQHGDVFISQRALETIDNTELAGIKTLREAREKLAERLGRPVEEVTNLDATSIDAYTYDTALAEKHPIYRLLVEETSREMLKGEMAYTEVEQRMDELLGRARKSRKRSLIDILIPQDQLIFEYLESPNKKEFADKMTDDELEVAEFIREQYSEMRDYLISHQQMEKYREDYITHIRKSFLESVRDDGIKAAVTGVFEQQKEDRAVFEILDQKTSEVLPFEKFFQYAMQRSGEIDPTQNVGRAFLAYKKTFERKRALDALIPKMMVYTASVSDLSTTERGIAMNDSLERFVKEWINNKKGRRSDILKIKQGSYVDTTLRVMNSFMSILDLGFSIPAGIAVQGGEQVSTFVMLGAHKYAKGARRMATKKGREIARKYENFTGRNPWTTLSQVADDFGDTVAKSGFVFFADASQRANRQYLLGSMTDAEFESGTISDERLAELQIDMGRFRVVNGAESIVGSTSVGKTWTKYRTWAIPILRTTIADIQAIIKDPAKLKQREGQELLRIAIVDALALTAFFALAGDDEKKESEKTFFEKTRDRLVRDVLSLLGAFDATLLVGSPRLMNYLGDITKGLMQIIKLEEYKTSGDWGEKGSLRGDNTIIRANTPMILKQFNSPE